MASSISSSFVFIDASVENYQSLAAGALADRVYVLDLGDDGISQITQILSLFRAEFGSQNSFNSDIHIVSHGSPGCLLLGNSELSLSTLDRYTAQVQSWFTSSGSLSLYGCKVAAGDAGTEFIDRLSNLVGVPIAASNTLTGAAQGGNWQLEVKTGEVAPIAFDPQTLEHYTGTLVAVNPNGVTLTSGNVTWSLANQLGTSNRLPSGGVADGSAGFGADNATVPEGDIGVGAVSNGLMLYVNNQIFSSAATADLTGQTLTVKGASKLSNLDVSMQYAALPGKPVMRTLASFSNPTNAAITIAASWVTNLRTGESSEVKAVSNTPNVTARWPQFELTKEARWVITDEDDRTWEGQEFGNGGGSNYFDAASTNVLFGSGNPAVVPESVSGTVFQTTNESNHNRGVLANYQITIPANSTRSLLFFYGVTRTVNQAKAAVGVYNDNAALKSANYLQGLTRKQLGETLNWQLTNPGITIAPVGNLTTTEAGGTASVAIVLESKPSANVAISLTSSDSKEGKAPSSVTFTPDNWFTPQAVTLQGVDDKVKDGNVTYKIQTKASSADLVYAAIDPEDLSVTNLDNESNGTSLPPVNTPSTDRGIRLTGTSRKETLSGTAQNDILLGLGGNDKLLGEAGNDVLEGGAGIDLLDGGSGQDILKGGRGKDVLVGRSSADVFVLAAEGTDIIRDFANGSDKLGLSGSLKFRDLEVVRHGRQTWIEQGETVLAVLNGVKPNQISTVDFVKV